MDKQQNKDDHEHEWERLITVERKILANIAHWKCKICEEVQVRLGAV